MKNSINKINLMPLPLLAWALIVIIVLFIFQGSKGFSFWDEGFLWYGVQRVMMGEVPIRDFMAYDPGRYYWSAMLMNWLGNNGIIALRGAVAVFQGIGLFVGLWLIFQSKKENYFLYLLLSTFTLIVWMFPRHKLFDISLSILSVSVLAFLVQYPRRRNFFFAGLFVGFTAVFGRNHGVYAFIAFLGAFCWIAFKQSQVRILSWDIAYWFLGIGVGFSPILLMILLVPGFAIAYLDSIRFLFEIRATNLPLPVPWPWLLNFKLLSFSEFVRGVLIGLFFIALILFGILFLFWIIYQKFYNKHVSPVLVATAFLALPYAHYAYSRADVPHLAQGIFPLLIGCLALLNMQPDRVKWPFAITLCAASIWVMHVFHPAWQCRPSSRCLEVEISGSNLQVDPATANDIVLIRNLSNLYAPKGQSFISTPIWPGAYALLERKSPLWEIYALFPRSQAFEQAEIERIKLAKPGFALVFDIPLDGNDDLRFRKTHPLIYQYISDNFELLPDSPNPVYQIYKANDLSK